MRPTHKIQRGLETCTDGLSRTSCLSEDEGYPVSSKLVFKHKPLMKVSLIYAEWITQHKLSYSFPLLL